MAPRRDLIHLDGNLTEDEIHVWHSDLALSEQGVEKLFQLLDSDERDRAARFKVPDPRRQFVISRAFLRILLGRYLQLNPIRVSFRVSAHGKPELGDVSDLRFNLSHTEGAAVIAITRGRRVGIDVERIRQNLNPLELADRFFSREESEWLRSQSATQQFAAFFACWTAKEAYVKACGGGLSMPLTAFAVKPGLDNAQLELQIYREPESARRWSLWQLDFGPDLRSALAVEGENLAVRIGEWSPSL
jgi:4'-phosphopantetheinyl transferase